MRTSWPAILLLLAFRGTAQPAFEIAPSEENLPVIEQSYGARIAGAGDGFLAVWMQYERGVRAMLLDRDGAPALARDFFVGGPWTVFMGGSSLYQRVGLDVASDGHNYLVAYSHAVDAEWTTRFARVTREGKTAAGGDVVEGMVRSLVFHGGYYIAVLAHPDRTATLTLLNREGIVQRTNVPVAHPDQHRAALDALLHVTNDDRLMVLWDPRAGLVVYAAFVTIRELFDGGFAGVRPRTSLDYFAFPVAIAQEGERILVASLRPNQLLRAALDDDGTLLESHADSFEGLPHRGSVTVAPLRAGFAIVVNAVQVPSFATAMSLLRVDREGRLLAAEFQSMADRSEEVASAVTSDGSALLAHTEASGRNVRVQWLDDAAEPHGGGGTIVSLSRPAHQQAVVATCNDKVYVAWMDTSAGTTTVRLRRYWPDGVPIDPPHGALTPWSSAVRMDLRVTCGRGSALVTWKEGALVAGAFLEDGLPSLARAGGESEGPIYVGRGWFGAAHFDGRDFLVLSTPGDHIIKRWSESGQEIDTRVLPRAIGEQGAALAGSGDELLLFTYGTDAKPFVLQRLDRRVAPDGEPMRLDLSATSVRGLAVARKDEVWLAAWMSCAMGECVPYAARFRSDGTVLDAPSGIVVGPPRRWTTLREPAVAITQNAHSFEVLSDGGVATITPGGVVTARMVPLAGETLEGMAEGRDRRMLVFTRFEMDDGVDNLFGTLIDTNSWAAPAAPRRRSVRP